MLFKQSGITSIAFVIILGLLISCNEQSDEITSDSITFGQPIKVNVLSYDDHIMEPFLSRDGSMLFFNNLNHSDVNTNLHFASKINDSVFQYMGEIKGVNTEYLEAVPSMTNSSEFYFISTRSYNQTLSTIYIGVFNNDSLSEIKLVSGISKEQAGWVNFDVEVSKDGNFLYATDGLFDENGGPYESDLVEAVNNTDKFERTDNKNLVSINTVDLEYATCISTNMLELYFTRVKVPLTETSVPEIYVATRASLNEAFGEPYKIKETMGFVEAPTLSPDNQILYYHKRDNNKFELYMIVKE